MARWREKIEAAPRRPETNREIVVALSGGKDSSAMALAQAMYEPRSYTYVITPTGNELPVMIAHWRKLSEMLGAPLTPILHSARSLQGLIRQQAALPNHRARWCTRLLKLEPYYQWLATRTPCISCVGLRADEESRPGMIFPDADGIEMDFPMRRWGWTLEDVLEFLRDNGVEVPERTDCAVCFWQRLGEWYLLWRDNPELYAEGEALEEFVSTMRGERYSFRSPDRDAWPASLKDLRAEFEAGRVPTRSLAMMDKRRQIGACRVCTL
jgi:3'-phosphoadenosine 5'-phosphosulfate sulfotransferase (PAPS reductase)/FAD synthetase